MTETAAHDDFESIDKMKRDIKNAAASLSAREARFLVDTYYQMQGNRTRAGNQLNALCKAEEPHQTVAWCKENAWKLEKSIHGALDVYSDASELGRWVRSIPGFGPIKAAGLLAHIDLEKAETAGAIWRFAGLDPSVTWHGKKGAEKLIKEITDGKKLTEDHLVEIAKVTSRHLDQLRDKAMNAKGKLDKGKLETFLARRPWNARLKVVCYHIGVGIVTTSNKENSYYGPKYREYKERVIERNKAGEFKELAIERAPKFKGTAQYAAYRKGMLPAGHVDFMARRYVIKLFLAHYHEKGRTLLGLPVPAPYPIQHMGHTHKFEVPE